MADELFKTIDINGESFVVKKFTAKQGLNVARFILAKAAPLIPYLSEEESAEADDKAILALMNMLDDISDKDLDELVDKCLKCCYKNLPAGMQAVMDSAGNYGVDGVEYDLLKTVRLCFEAIRWGASAFFGEEGSLLIAQAFSRLGFKLSP